MDFDLLFQRMCSYSAVPGLRSACHELSYVYGKFVATYMMHGKKLSHGEYNAGIPWQNSKRRENKI
jgi:hypothetical protein